MHGMEPNEEIDYWRERAKRAESKSAALADEIARLRRLCEEACDLAERRECIDDADQCRCDRLLAMRREIGGE